MEPHWKLFAVAAAILAGTLVLSCDDDTNTGDPAFPFLGTWTGQLGGAPHTFAFDETGFRYTSVLASDTLQSRSGWLALDSSYTPWRIDFKVMADRQQGSAGLLLQSQTVARHLPARWRHASHGGARQSGLGRAPQQLRQRDSSCAVLSIRSSPVTAAARGMGMRLATLLLVTSCLIVSCGGAGNLDATVTGISGGAQIHRYGYDTWDILDTNSLVGFGDSVRVLNEAFVELTFGNGNTVRIDQNSKVSFSDIIDTNGERILEVFDHYGVVLSTIEDLEGPYARYSVRTPEAVFDAHGTTFVVRYELEVRNAEVEVVNGEVWAVQPSIPAPPVVIQPGFFVAVPYRVAPAPPEKIGLVRWRRLERVMAPPLPLRRPSVYVVRDMPPPRRVRHVQPPHARPGLVAPAPKSHGPGVLAKGRPAKAPRVLRPAPHAKVRAPGKAVRSGGPGGARSKATVRTPGSKNGPAPKANRAPAKKKDERKKGKR
jgi:hypothetical protein